MPFDRPLPDRIAGFAVPHGRASVATWRWAGRALPTYLLNHSVRTWCWGIAIAAEEGWTFDAEVFWTASLFHDVGLTRVGRNLRCFEVEGGARARRFLARHGLDHDQAAAAERAILLHMQPLVGLDDGVESFLLDRATALDVRGVDAERVQALGAAVLGAYPRAGFDRRFLAAIGREVEVRGGCQSERLLNQTDLAGWMARSTWAGKP